MTTRRPDPDPAALEITRMDCRQCGTEIFGIEGRYACALCGWVNVWSEGNNELPSEDDDADWPRPQL